MGILRVRAQGETMLMRIRMRNQKAGVVINAMPSDSPEIWDRSRVRERTRNQARKMVVHPKYR
jgi:hypothetical protein